MEKRLITTLLKQLKHGTLKITYWDGETQTYGHGAPKAHITLNDRKVLRKMLKSPSLALGEAYMNGTIDIAEPFEDVLKLSELNPLDLSIGSVGKQLRRLTKNKRQAQAKQIAHHYDIGNEFYRLWLDKETMLYTCAYFHTPKDTLAQAQRQKVDHVLRKLQIKPDQSLLDIGCGWGYLLLRAAEKYGAMGLGVTLSHEQQAYATAEAKKRGLDKQVKFELLNYQDLLERKRTFDRVVSVGILEHVGIGSHQIYFDVVNHTLKDGGISVLHSITHQDESPSDAWIDKYIFPGGYIPSVREITSLTTGSGFHIFDYENLGQHYALTLSHWWHNFEQHKDQVINMYDERFYRMWRLYLLGAMNTFKTGGASLSQWTFKKGSDPTWPLTREYLYKNKA
jgi:cyclopropane-fatty-acyl-phospholipid synthase